MAYKCTSCESLCKCDILTVSPQASALLRGGYYCKLGNEVVERDFLQHRSVVDVSIVLKIFFKNDFFKLNLWLTHTQRKGKKGTFRLCCTLQAMLNRFKAETQQQAAALQET